MVGSFKLDNGSCSPIDVRSRVKGLELGRSVSISGIRLRLIETSYICTCSRSGMTALWNPVKGKIISHMRQQEALEYDRYVALLPACKQGRLNIDLDIVQSPQSLIFLCYILRVGKEYNNLLTVKSLGLVEEDGSINSRCKGSQI